MRVVFGLAVLLAAVPVAAQAPAHHDHPTPERLGRVHFATSCSSSVAADFDRAVALLHSFSFSTAKAAFEGVLQKDPSCAMAYWGIALTHWQNPFAVTRPPGALPAGSAAAERARSTGTPTPRERDYIAAVNELYKSSATVDQRTRVLAYERAMEHVYRTYPDDREAAAFYALAATQAALPTDKTYAQQLKAGAILDKLFAEQPEHPGLAHYIIHAYDYPPLASRALDAARRYAKIAPSAPHALHMPSHTFTRVGAWQDSVESNIASAAASIRDRDFGEALHAMDYQVYAYLQTGQDAAARKLVADAPRVLARLDVNVMGGAAPGFAGLYAAAALPARYALERGAWKEAAALETTSTAYAWVDAVRRFARALGAARSGSIEAARADVAQLKSLTDKLLAAKDADWGEKTRIQHEVASAWVAFAEGRQQEGLGQLRKAADAEDATDKSAISPGPLAPARELLGEMLLAMNRPADAVKEFEATLQKEPNRFRATYYAAKSASLAGDTAKAREHFRHLVEVCRKGDAPGRPELEEARKVKS
jgi:Tfp pilus assembly protein PilF